jgi:hypothetical protein
MNIDHNDSIYLKKIDDIEEEDITCPICYENCININIECDKCPYKFHEECLKRCFMTAKRQICPMCRCLNQIEFYL